MKFQKILFSFFVTLFIKVWADDGTNIDTTFIGLKGDRGMGHSGYVYVSTDLTAPDFEMTNCKYLEVNDTMCMFNVTTQNNEGAILLLHAWTAVTLRENILSILGYLLHQSKIAFRESVESSLKIIYEEVRKNNIKILEFMPRFKAIMRMDKAHRSASLFRALQVAMPAYCRSALEELVRTFLKFNNRVIDMNSTPDNPSIEIGTQLMANIDMRVSRYLRPKIVRRSYDRSIGYLFGREYAIFFSAIHTGKLILTQPVLAILISITRFVELSATEMEDLNFLIDVLLLNKIPGWLPARPAELADINGPYVLINKMLNTIANHTTVDPTSRNIAANLQSRLISGFIINRTKPMYQYFGTQELNVTLILDLLEEMAPIPEVKMLCDMIYNGTLHLNYTLKGFNRYHYDTPEKLVLAFVRRIQLRVPLDGESKDIIQNIVLHLLGSDNNSDDPNEDEDTRKRRNTDVLNISEAYVSNDSGEGVTIIRKTMCDRAAGCMTTVSDSSALRDLEPVTVELRRSLSNCPNELPGPSLSLWLKSLDRPVDNYEPSLLVVNVSTLLAMFMNDPLIKKCIHNSLFNQTNEENCMNQVTLIADLFPYNSTISSNSIVQSTMKDQIPVLAGTKKNLLKQILKEMLSMEQVRARMMIYYEVMRVYCILVHGIGDHNPTTLAADLLLDHPRCGDIIEKLSRIVSEPFRKLIDEHDLKKQKFLIKLKPEPMTNRRFLVKLCKRLLTLPAVKQKDKLFDEIILFLHLIQELPMEFTDLIDDIWTNHSPQKIDTHSIFDYFAKTEFLYALGEDFDIGRYPIKDRLLRAILVKISKHPTIKQDKKILASIKAHLPLITCTSHGAESLIPTFLEVELGHLFVPTANENTERRAETEPDYEQIFANLWKWYAGDDDSTVTLRISNSSAEGNRTQYYEGVLNAMESNVDRDYFGIKKDIETMRAAILRTKNGTAPVASV